MFSITVAGRCSQTSGELGQLSPAVGALVTDGTEQLAHSAVVDARVGLGSLHGVCLAGPSLPIGKGADVVAVQSTGHKLAHVLKHLRLFVAARCASRVSAQHLGRP